MYHIRNISKPATVLWFPLEKTLSYSVKQLTSAECSDPEAANSEAHALL